jgi:hypothetical protein
MARNLDFELMGAISDGNVSEVKRLISEGANPNSEYMQGPFLFLAIGYDNPEVVKALIDAGANVNAVHNRGETALMVAVASDSPAVVRTLVDAGADVTAKNPYGGRVSDYAKSDAMWVFVKQAEVAQLGKEVRENTRKAIRIIEGAQKGEKVSIRNLQRPPARQTA